MRSSTRPTNRWMCARSARTSWRARPTNSAGRTRGIVSGRRELLESWRPYKARPVPMEPVGHRFETGTLPYELLGGLLATFNYLDSLGGMARLAAWEHEL